MIYTQESYDSKNDHLTKYIPKSTNQSTHLYL